MLEINKIYNMDCIEGMKLIPDNSIDCIITDPPYGTTACKRDTIIPFDLMREQLNRIIKPNGAIVLFGSEPFSSALRMSNIKNYKYDWIWAKKTTTGFQHAKNMPLRNNEIISVFSRGSMGHLNLLGDKRMCYNPQGIIKVDKISKNTENKWGSIVGKRPSHKQEFLTEFENYPRMILEFPSCKGLHPTQKPVALIEYLVKTYTNEGETVLDFTMGSGTTAVACLNTNRNFVGFELDKGYREIANKRIGNLDNIQ